MSTMLFEPEVVAPTATQVITPCAQQYWATLDLVSAVSHHDPGQADKSNFSQFRRKKVFVDLATSGQSVNQADLDEICRLNPIPASLEPIFRNLPLPHFLGAALFWRFITSYTRLNNGEGAGLFSGIERYRMLEERAAQQAVGSVTLFDFWGNLCRELQVPIESDRDLLWLLAVPSLTAGIVLREIQERPRPLVTIALAWRESLGALWKPVWSNRKDKKQNSDERNIEEPSVENDQLKILRYEASEHDRSSIQRIAVQMPDISPNSIRHEMVREPAMLHLLNRLGIGWHELPPGVAALLYSGGGIEAGESAPMNAHQLREIACRKIPTLGLLGGSTSGFMLGESSLKVNAWIICKENNEATKRIGIVSNESVFDMLDRETLVRHPARVGQTPMPFSFETVAQGGRIVVCFSLSVYARPYESGALAAAIKTFQDADGTIAGQSARGFGKVDLEWVGEGPDSALYEEYLSVNREQIREWLLSGTLGTDKVICL